MPTTPTAFAEVVRFSKSPVELRNRVLSLYRLFIRRSPNFVEMYEMDVPVGIVRTKLREQFERNRFVEDIRVRNALLAQGHNEFQETVNFWKQPGHVLKYFDEYFETKVEKKEDDFVRKFIKNEA